MGWAPSSSDITINESVISRERASAFGTGLITCRKQQQQKRLSILVIRT